MYAILLALHSFVRWLVLASLVFTIYKAYQGWFSSKPFTNFDNFIRHSTATISHIQLLIGLLLYYISPIVTYFLQNFNEAVHNREIRFFGMEHSLMMFIAVSVISAGSSIAKRKAKDAEKFRTMAIWYTIALFIIFFSIPWNFSPLVSRPYLRLF
jgi:hypothetical protein